MLYVAQRLGQLAGHESSEERRREILATLDALRLNGRAPTGERDPLTERYRPVDWHDVWAKVASEPEWLVSGVIERGRSHALFGPSKSGKSLLTLAMVAALSTGRSPFGRAGPAGRVRVLYVDQENALADLRERLGAMGYGPDELDELVYFSFPPLPALDSPAGGSHLCELVERFRPDLVVLDTVSRVVAGPENDADTFRALYRHALVPLKAAGVAVWRIDHTGKDPTAGQRGSSGKGDDVDTVWLLVPRGTERFTLRLDRQRSSHHPEHVELIRLRDPLRFVRLDAGDDRPEVAELVAELDRLGVLPDAGRDAARPALTAAGIKVNNTTLADAIKIRKARPVCPENLSGTDQPETIMLKIDTGCPEDQSTVDVTADQTCPGQVADSADSPPESPKG